MAIWMVQVVRNSVFEWRSGVDRPDSFSYKFAIPFFSWWWQRVRVLVVQTRNRFLCEEMSMACCVLGYVLSWHVIDLLDQCLQWLGSRGYNRRTSGCETRKREGGEASWLRFLPPSARKVYVRVWGRTNKYVSLSFVWGLPREAACGRLGTGVVCGVSALPVSIPRWWFETSFNRLTFTATRLNCPFPTILHQECALLSMLQYS